MSVIAETEELALSLSASDRAKLAEKLVFFLSEKDRAELVGKILRSLPLYDDDGGLAEAKRRDREMDENPESILSMEQLDELIKERFPFVRK